MTEAATNGLSGLIEEISAFEKKHKKATILWLARKIADKNGHRVTEQLCKQILNAITQNRVDWQALHLARKQEPCLNMASYLGCPCEGYPITRCKRCHNIYTVKYWNDAGGQLQIQTGAQSCEKYQNERENQQRNTDSNSIKACEYEERRRKLL